MTGPIPEELYNLNRLSMSLSCTCKCGQESFMLTESRAFLFT